MVMANDGFMVLMIALERKTQAGHVIFCVLVVSLAALSYSEKSPAPSILCICNG
jgi:uncharacterized membrane protein YobD (UPF0266 family)